MMKKYIPILLILILSANNLVAQPYKSIFGDSCSIWTNSASGLGVTHLISVSYQRDTIVNNRNYHIVYGGGSGVIPSTVQPTNNLSHTFFHSVALVREDTNTGKVWYRYLYNNNSPIPDTLEKLVVDMSLQVGDSFLFNPWLNHYIHVDSVYYDAYNRKTVKFDWPRITFIEGVTSTLGLFYKDSLLSQTIQPHDLICVIKDSLRTYTSEWSKMYNNGDCIPWVSINDISTNQPIPIYPNPNNGLFTIDLPSAKQAEMIISDISGRVILKEKVTDKRKYRIDIRNQPKGIYLLQLTTSEGMYHAKVQVE